VCDLHASVEGAVYILGAEARRRGVELESALDDSPELARVPGSPASWQTVIFNLVLNAVRHTAAGTTVRVELGLWGTEGLVFTTANPAPELSAADLERVFEPFVSSADRSEATEDPAGTGLGLALVRRRVDELGAEVSARLVDGEARFRVELSWISSEESAA
jgi:signal transduction histidine kinase